MTPPPVTHEEARALINLSVAGGKNHGTLLRYIAQAEQTERDLTWMTSQRDVMNDKLNEYIDKTVAAERRAREAERERDELKAKLAQAGEQERSAALDSVLDALAADTDQSPLGQRALVRAVGHVLAVLKRKPPPQEAEIISIVDARRRRGRT